MGTEVLWRSRPQPVFSEDGQELKVGLSSWSGTSNQKTIEVVSDIDDESHVITIFQRRTRGELYINGRSVQNCYWAQNDMLATGPKEGRWRGLIHGSDYHAFRIFLPQGLLGECYRAMLGKEAPSQLVLFETAPIRDKGLYHLAHAFKEIANYEKSAAIFFADALGLAFASRLLTLYLRRDTGTRTILAKSEPSRMRLVVSYIEENLQKDLYLSELSAVAGLNRVHFSSLFKAEMGCSPYAYVMRRRIACAQNMLRRPDVTIIGVALDLGFSSQAHFTDVFRKIVGVTPSKWQKLQID